MSDWIDDTLIDPKTHLVFDGINDGSLVRAQYTYCQGVVVGLENWNWPCGPPMTGMAPGGQRDWWPPSRENMAPRGVLVGGGGGDGGLFAGITAR